MSQIIRAKAIIDALAGHNVTAAKAEKIVRRYMGDFTSPVDEMAEAFNLKLINVIRGQMRDNGGKAEERDTPARIQAARDEGYNELSYEP